MGTSVYSYLFDSIGNRVEANEAGSEWEYIANQLNQYASITNNSAPVVTAHDADGNMTTAPLSSFGGSLLSSTLGWSGENRMITASNTAMVASYNYDYMGRRFEKTVVTNSVTTTNTFIYDGWNLVQETSGTNITRYVWGLDLSGSMQGAGGIGGLLCVIENGTPYYPCKDANGNITDYVDETGTNVVAHREFDPFGNTIVATGDKVNDFNFWFSSKYLDQETGLYYYGFRFYLPALGRWLSRDPIGEIVLPTLFGSQADVVVGAMGAHWLYGISERGSLDDRIEGWFTAIGPIDTSYSAVGNNALSAIDSFGLYQLDIIDCPYGKDKELRGKYEDACKKILNNELVCECWKPGKSAQIGETDSIALKALKISCRSKKKVRVKCLAADHAACKPLADGSSRCGLTQHRAGGVGRLPGHQLELPPGAYLCPRAFDPKADCGGDPFCTLIHEVGGHIGIGGLPESEYLPCVLEKEFGCREPKNGWAKPGE